MLHKLAIYPSYIFLEPSISKTISPSQKKKKEKKKKNGKEKN